MITQSRVHFVALLALVMVSGAACNVGPTSPTPVDSPVATCTDPAARNVGGPLPCVLPIASTLRTTEITPPSGSVLSSAAGPPVRITISWVLDPYIPGRIVLAVYFSVDCVNVISGSRSTFGSSDTQGTITLTTRLSKGMATQTNCVINRLETVDSNNNTLEVVVTEVVPWVFHHQ